LFCNVAYQDIKAKCVSFELKGVPEIQNYQEASVIKMLGILGLPTKNQTRGHVCLDSERIDILNQYSTPGDFGKSNFYLLRPWGSFIYYEFAAETKPYDIKFLEEHYDKQTLMSDFPDFFDLEGTPPVCNIKDPNFENGYCQSILEDDGACCMSYTVENMS
jgi:hypothetical protein